MVTTGKVGLIVGWITLFIMGTDLFVVSPLLPFISFAYNISSSVTGWMVTVFSLTYAIAAPFYGWASDKRGRTTFITVGLLLFSFANGLTAFSPSFTSLIMSRILAGLSVAAITPLIYALISDLAPISRKGTWLSIVVSGHLTALWAGAPVGTLMESFLGWRSVFISLAVTGVALSIVNFLMWKSVPKNQIETSKAPSRNLVKILRSVSVTTIWAISMYALYIYLGAALYTKNQFNPSEISLSITFYGIGAVLGSLTSGQLTDKFGERKISRTAIICLSLVLIFLGVFFSYGDWIYFFLFIWAYVGYAGFTSYQALLSVDYPNERGKVLAWNNTGLYIGITLGSIIGGIIIKEWGYAILPYFCSFAAIISFVMSSLKTKGE